MLAQVKRFMPIFARLPACRRRALAGDTVACLTVAIMLVPQAMACALLAGLPPQVSLYASILPLLLYGSSRTFAAGPDAIVSFDTLTLRKAWQYNKADALLLVASFAAVLTLGIVLGIVVGAILSIALYLWRTSRPHVAVVGREGNSGHFRNLLRYEVQTDPHILAVRIDESLYFANSTATKDRILAIPTNAPTQRRSLRDTSTS